jgi:putative salt-induced outer membrane protein
MTRIRLSALALVVLAGACTSQQERERQEKERAEIAARAEKVEAQAKEAEAKADAAQRTAGEAKAMAQQNDSRVGEPGPGTPPETAQAAPAATPPAPKCDCPPPPPPPPPPHAKLGGEFSLGQQSTTGNTQTRSVNSKLSVVYKNDPWKNAFEAAWLEASDHGKASAFKYNVGDKLNRDLSRRNFVFGQVEYDMDHFGPFRERLSETAGYGYHVLPGPVHILDLDVGVGARQQTTNQTPLAPRTRSNDFIGRFDGKYEWKITEKSSFVETVKYEPGRHNVYEESVTELKMPVFGSLSAVLSYTVKHNSTAPPPTKNTDTATAISLAYSFGEK